MILKSKIFCKGIAYGYNDNFTSEIIDNCVKRNPEVDLFLDGEKEFLKIGKCKFVKRNTDVWAIAEIDNTSTSIVEIMLEKFKYVAMCPELYVKYNPIDIHAPIDERCVQTVSINNCILRYSDITSELKPYKVKTVD